MPRRVPLAWPSSVRRQPFGEQMPFWNPKARRMPSGRVCRLGTSPGLKLCGQVQAVPDSTPRPPRPLSRTSTAHICSLLSSSSSSSLQGFLPGPRASDRADLSNHGDLVSDLQHRSNEYIAVLLILLIITFVTV